MGIASSKGLFFCIVKPNLKLKENTNEVYCLNVVETVEVKKDKIILFTKWNNGFIIVIDRKLRM
jgi:hypothetical protein